MKFICVFAYLFIFSFANAQRNDFHVETKYKHGFSIAHRQSMSHLPEDHLNSVELNFLFQTNGKKAWHKALNYPCVGIVNIYTNGGNKAILGQFFGSVPTIEFTLLNRKRSQIKSRLGAGMGFTSKVFDPNLNPKNVAMSSHLNVLANLAFSYKYTVNKNCFSLGLDLTHFSNGGTKLPNLGVNLAYFTMGYARNINKYERENKVFEKSKREWQYSAGAIYGYKTVYPYKDNSLHIFGMSFLAQKKFSHKVGYETGIDLIYKPSIRNYKPVIPKSAESMMQIGLYNSYFMSLDKLQIHVGVGLYLRDEYVADDHIYNRFGCKYAITENLILNMCLKTHWAKADYIEYGFSYRF